LITRNPYPLVRRYNRNPYPLVRRYNLRREVTTEGVGWASEEASDLVPPPLNMVLYIHLRIFTYTWNVLIASFEYMELILASGTLKNFRFLLRSCLSTDRASVIKVICSTFNWTTLGDVSPYL
jgi:hypothetical protein